MATLRIRETPNSRAQKAGKSATFSYQLDKDDEGSNPATNAAIETLVLATAPLIYRGLRRESDLQIRHRDLVIYVNVGYKKVENEQDDGFKIAIDLGGGTATVKQSIETISSHLSDHERNLPDPPDRPPRHNGLIGVNGDSVEGVTIPVPSFEFTLTRYISDSQIDGFLNNMQRLQSLVNQDSVTFLARGWRPTFAPGELLFLGGSPTPRTGTDEEDWEVPLRFAAEANVRQLQLEGFGNSSIEKDGHDYIWVTHKDSDDVDAKSLARVPQAAYVERVIYRGELSSLLR